MRLVKKKHLEKEGQTEQNPHFITLSQDSSYVGDWPGGIKNLSLVIKIIPSLLLTSAWSNCSVGFREKNVCPM